MSEQDDGIPHAPARSRRRLVLLSVAGVAVLVLAIVAVVLVRDSGGSREATAVGTPTQRAPSSSPTPDPTRPAPAAPTMSAAEVAQAQQELAGLAAALTGPVVLSSPADWDQWGPQGPPYPDNVDDGFDEDMARCPTLAAGLGAATGVGWSYHTGTLPRGPVGCTWATVPLYYGPDQFNPTYFAFVGFLKDGTTVQEAGRGFLHHQGQQCPYLDVPSLGSGAVLARCEEQGKIEFLLAAPDARTSGVWVLGASARPEAPLPSQDVMAAVLEGVVAAYG